MRISSKDGKELEQKGEWPNAEATVTLECLDHVTVVMFHLRSMLMASDEKSKSQLNVTRRQDNLR